MYRGYINYNTNQFTTLQFIIKGIFTFHKVNIIGTDKVHFINDCDNFCSNGWLAVFGITALSDSISVCIRPSPRERDKEEKSDR